MNRVTNELGISCHSHLREQPHMIGADCLDAEGKFGGDFLDRARPCQRAEHLKFPLRELFVRRLPSGRRKLTRQSLRQARRNVLADGLVRLGWNVARPKAGMFVWAEIPEPWRSRVGSIDFAMKLLDEAEVAVSPGRGFGELGEGFLRLALVENEHRLRQAIRQIGRCLLRNDHSAVSIGMDQIAGRDSHAGDSDGTIEGRRGHARA